MKPSERIMHVILEPRYSGAETLVRDLSMWQIRSGASVAIVCLRPSQPSFLGEVEQLRENGCYVALPETALEGWKRIHWIRRGVKKFHPDVVFSHSALPSLYTRMALFCENKPNAVTVLHTDDDFSDWKLRAAEMVLAGHHSTVVGVSRRSLKNYARRIPRGGRLVHIPNGTRIKYFHMDNTERRQARIRLFGSSDQEVILLQVGRIGEQKQQEVSIEALATLRAEGFSNLRLILVGLTEDQGYFQRLKGLADRYELGRQITWLGPRRDIRELLGAADIHLMPSAWEAHSIAALEALASGISCVFSSIDAFTGLLHFDGVRAIGVPPKVEALSECLRMMLTTREYTSRYERDLSPYDIEACAERYSRLITSLLNRPTRSA